MRFSASDLSEVRIVDLVHNKADHRRRAAGQGTGVDIGYVAEVLCHITNLLGKRSANPGLAVKRPRSGCQ